MTEAETTKWARAEAAKDLQWADQQYKKALRSGDQAVIDKATKDRDQAYKVHRLVNGFEGTAAAVRYGEQRIKRGELDEDKPKDKPDDDGGPGLSATFYRDLGAMLTGRPVGNIYDRNVDQAKQLMHQKNNESAREDMESQDAWQRGTRNEYAEAGKEASFKNDAMNRQRMNQTAFTGSNRGRMRELTEPDVRHWQQYGSQQRQLGQQRADAADTDREGAIVAHGESERGRINSRDYDSDLNESRRLSMGYGYRDSEPKPAQTPPYIPPPEREETPEPEPIQHDPASPQRVLNYMTYGADQSSRQYNGAGMDDDAWALWKEWGSPSPLTPEEAAQYGGFNIGEGPLQQAISKLRPEAWNSYVQATEDTRHIGAGNQLNVGSGVTQEQIDNMRVNVGGVPGQANQTVTRTSSAVGNSGRGGMPSNVPNKYACGTNNAKPGLAWVGENGPELVNFNGGEQVYPFDYQVFLNEICDERCKQIRNILDSGGSLSKEDYRFLADQAGDLNGQSLFDDDGELTSHEDSVLDGYGQHIYNYLYNYKPGTENIDPRIDSNEEHIGPMAQDIEKVNPACVKETPEGIKTVDTGRLAMMNAGAIGDLVRRVNDLERMIGALNGRA